MGALTGGLESAAAPRGSDADSRGSNWTKMDSAADSTWVEPRRIHQVRRGLRRTPTDSTWVRRGSNLVLCTSKSTFGGLESTSPPKWKSAAEFKVRRGLFQQSPPRTPPRTFQVEFVDSAADSTADSTADFSGGVCGLRRGLYSFLVPPRT